MSDRPLTLDELHQLPVRVQPEAGFVFPVEFADRPDLASNAATETTSQQLKEILAALQGLNDTILHGLHAIRHLIPLQNTAGQARVVFDTNSSISNLYYFRQLGTAVENSRYWNSDPLVPAWMNTVAAPLYDRVVVS